MTVLLLNSSVGIQIDRKDRQENIELG